MLNVLAILAGILTATLSPQSQSAGAPPTGSGEIGDPCDPETYDGPYMCVEDPNSISGYAIAN
jgi:hypothetical protein